jgi:hypothetical protein
MVQRSEFSAVKRSHEEALQAAQKVEEQFKSTMSKLDELSTQGHAGAKMLMDSLQNRQRRRAESEAIVIMWDIFRINGGASNTAKTVCVKPFFTSSPYTNTSAPSDSLTEHKLWRANERLDWLQVSIT